MPFVKNLYHYAKWRLTSPARKKQALEAALRSASFVPETRAMIEDARGGGVEFCFDPKLLFSKAYALYRHDGKKNVRKIVLCPPCGNPALTDLALAHELRHMAQYLALKDILGKEKTARTFSPRGHLLLNRLLEADAYAYCDFELLRAGHIMEDMKAAQIRAAEKFISGTPEYVSARRAAFQQRLAARPAADYAAALKKGFLDMLPAKLAVYDKAALRESNAFHTCRDANAAPVCRALPFAEVRRALPLSYLDGISDRALEIALLRPVKPQIRKTVRLMEKFIAAAKDGRHDADLQRQILSRVYKPG